MTSFPYSVEPLEDKENEAIKRDFKGYLSGAVRVQPGGYFFQGIYRDYAQRIYDFELRSNDIFVISYPKCGTTWTQEMVWLLMNDFDYEGAKTELDVRFPFIEADHVLDPDVFQLPGIKEKLNFPAPEPGERLALANGLASPRTLKSHMPFSLLPPTLLDTCKVIYVARNPWDVVVSYYHHHRMWATHGYVGDFKTFLNYFIAEKIMWSPFWSHLQEAWEKRHHHNFLLVTYDQLKEDLPAVIKRVADFLDFQLIPVHKVGPKTKRSYKGVEGPIKNLSKSPTPDEMKKLTEHLQFDSMKNNPAVNCINDSATGLLDLREGGFVRKGKSGGWHEYFDDEMKENFKNWISEKALGLEKEFNWI